jgi:hypothetical protein
MAFKMGRHIHQCIAEDWRDLAAGARISMGRSLRGDLPPAPGVDVPERRWPQAHLL